MTTKHYLELSREEKDQLADEKMKSMREKNAAVMKRHKEVEEDKRNAEVFSKSAVTNKKVDMPPPPDPSFNFLADRSRDNSHFSEDRHQGSRRHHSNYGGQDFENVPHAIQQRKKFDKEHPHDPPRSSMEMTLTMTGKARQEYAKWKAEREQIDNERVIRQKTSCGQWKREWDIDKITQEDEPVEYSPQIYRSVPYSHKRNEKRSFSSTKSRLTYSSEENTQKDCEFNSDHSNTRSVIISKDGVTVNLKNSSKNLSIDRNKHTENKDHVNNELDLKEKNGNNYSISLSDNKNYRYQPEKDRFKEYYRKQFESSEEMNDSRYHQKFQKNVTETGGIWEDVSDLKYKAEHAHSTCNDFKMGWEGNSRQNEFRERKQFEKGYRGSQRERNECLSTRGHMDGNQHKENFGHRYDETENVCSYNRNFQNQKDSSKGWYVDVSYDDKRLIDSCKARDMDNKRQGRLEQTVKKDYRNQDDEKINYRGSHKDKYNNKYHSKGWEQNENDSTVPPYRNKSKSWDFKEKSICEKYASDEISETQKIKNYGMKGNERLNRNDLVYNRVKRENSEIFQSKNEQGSSSDSYVVGENYNQYHQSYKNDKRSGNRNNHYNSMNFQNDSSFKNERRGKDTNRQYRNGRENYRSVNLSDKSFKNSFVNKAFNDKLVSKTTYENKIIGEWNDEPASTAANENKITDGWNCGSTSENKVSDGWGDEPLHATANENKASDGWGDEPASTASNKNKVISRCDSSNIFEGKKSIGQFVDESVNVIKRNSNCGSKDVSKIVEETLISECVGVPSRLEDRKSYSKLCSKPLSKSACKKMPRKSIGKQKQSLDECNELVHDVSQRNVIPIKNEAVYGSEVEDSFEKSKNISEMQNKNIILTENLNKGDLNLKSTSEIKKDINQGSLNDANYNLSPHDSDSWESLTTSNESFSEESEDLGQQDVEGNYLKSCPDSMEEHGIKIDVIKFSLSKLVVNDNANSKLPTKSENVKAWIKEVQESNSSFSNSSFHENKINVTESSEQVYDHQPEILSPTEFNKETCSKTIIEDSSVCNNDCTIEACLNGISSAEKLKSEHATLLHDADTQEYLLPIVVKKSVTEVCVLDKESEEPQSLDKNLHEGDSINHSVEDCEVQGTSSDILQHVYNELPECNLSVTEDANICNSNVLLDCNENLSVENSNDNITPSEVEESNLLQDNSSPRSFPQDASKNDLGDEIVC